jgi:hypothetical protein
MGKKKVFRTIASGSVLSTDWVEVWRSGLDSPLEATIDSLFASLGSTTAMSGFTIPSGNVTLTSGLLSAASTITSATPDTTRLGRFELTVTPATSVAVGSNGSLAGVRGAVTLSSSTSITDGYMYGVQGKVTSTGATIAVGSDHVAGLLGQITLGTVTNGHVAAVIGSIQTTPTSSAVDLFYGESATGNVINSYFKGFGKSTYVFDFESNVHNQMSTTGTAGATATKGWLKVLVEGVVRYIPLTDSVS